MNREKQYAGIDRFRLIAAVLVITIHTSPLSSVNGTADFILTRVIARVAVPFFLMTSGFFILPTYERAEKEKLLRFFRKTALLYGVSILLYLPVNFYAGKWRTPSPVVHFLKDIFINGTFYHLWYLPAALLGMGVSVLLLKMFGPGKSIGVAVLLYAVGLFGDSYFGAAKQIPFLNSFYNAVFSVCDYTRNGLFFAPIFLLSGFYLARHKKQLKLKGCMAGFSVTFALMLAEALLLRFLGWQRFDSMYVFLPGSMVFLFGVLIFWRGREKAIYRPWSMFVYIIHPMMIIFVRGVSKAIGLQALFIQNSVLHFLAVAVGSLVAGWIITKLLGRKKKKNKIMSNKYRDRAWAEISLSNLKHNLESLKSVLPPKCGFMAVVKANAYGHGDIAVSRYCNKIGIGRFAVATIEEGIRLRSHGIKGEILILGYTDPQRSRELVQYHLTQTIVSWEHAQQLDSFHIPLCVQIAVDTGMHRLGEDCKHGKEIEKIMDCENLKVCGLYSHLCASDSEASEDREYTNRQIQDFRDLLNLLKQDGYPIPHVHIQSSYGILNYPDLHCSYVRPGIAMYGVLSTPSDQAEISADLRPVLSLRARIILVRTVPSGESVGYGRAFTTTRETMIAILPIGYADGLPRNLSGGNGEILLHGRRAPIVGRICMDQLMADVTDIPDVKPGDVATLIGRDGQETISAEQVADEAGTITNELLSRLGTRLERFYFQSS
jgi:serine/alanine racemase